MMGEMKTSNLGHYPYATVRDGERLYTVEEMEAFCDLVEKEKNENEYKGPASSILLENKDSKPYDRTKKGLYRHLVNTNHQNKVNLKKSLVRAGYDSTDAEPKYNFNKQVMQNLIFGPMENLPTKINNKNPYYRAVAKWRLMVGD